MKQKTIRFQGGHLDYETITYAQPKTIDPVPDPRYFGLKSYTYLTWIWVDKKHRTITITNQQCLDIAL